MPSASVGGCDDSCTLRSFPPSEASVVVLLSSSSEASDRSLKAVDVNLKAADKVREGVICDHMPERASGKVLRRRSLGVGGAEFQE